MFSRQGAAKAGTVIIAAVVLASCGFGVTGTATGVTDTSATFTGSVGNTVVGTTNYRFEYGPTPAYGSATETVQTYISATNMARPVNATVNGLSEGTLYHYRLCATGEDGNGACGSDQTLTTTSGHDSVNGSGIVFSDPQLGYVYGAAVSASSDADGANPGGDATLSPGSYYFRLPDEGPVTCLKVVGNRAAIGFMAQPPGLGEPDPHEIPRLMFIEDNGPTGDRFSVGSIAAPATSCPTPTDTSFTAGYVGGLPVGPVLASGNFVVRDR